ncbi:MAG: restriction system protein, partial [Campylobacterota bacterium]|nr:restriction system protein [Campylobacterota bacterium]
DELTPSETIDISFKKIKNKIYNDILDTIISKTPREFEKLVVALLQKMGYGGEIQNSGEVTQYSNDNGIDGIIKEDVLGFGRIYIQAKRYKREIKIGREDLNKFVGALAVAQSNKGVFITTSNFNKNAIEYASKLNNNTTLVLIDGEQLAKYIYDYSLGMQTEQIIEIKKLDSDFWDSMEDDINI